MIISTPGWIDSYRAVRRGRHQKETSDVCPVILFPDCCIWHNGSILPPKGRILSYILIEIVNGL